MKYKSIKKGVFVERPNRFIAKVLVDGNVETVHVKNTGRCKELLVNGATVYLSVAENPLRKTKYDLVGVEKVTNRGTIMVNMDSQIPNDVAGEWLRNGNLFSENAVIKREVFYNKSRFDFYIEDEGRRIFLEVKGVTLENNSVASFPDAPTERGIKHINELVDAVAEGFEAYILFVIQMKNIDYFTPNYETHPEFGEALKIARDKGVKILAFDCVVTSDSIAIDKNIKVVL
ncbi:MAG: DNA/RNA nuclease SfsA [Clostridia bacterium]|nr:DNA/RNA nuclease SfsA [Clostridia bacterium]